MKSLCVGDIHAQVSSLDDLKGLFSFIRKQAVEHKVDQIVFLGDLTHCHHVLDLRIARFLREEVTKLISPLDYSIHILAGNHDYISPTNLEYSSIDLIFDGIDGINIYTNKSVEGVYVDDSYKTAFIPYNSKERFEEILKTIPTNYTVFCHQTITGATYENGFPAHDGADDSIVNNLLISGHIHLKSKLLGGKVQYIGTPRAVTAGEVNQEKFITIYNHDTNEFLDISTDHLVRCYKHIEVNEPNLDIPDLKAKDNDIVSISISGSQEYYSEFLDKNKWIIGKYKIIPNITTSIKTKIETKSSSIPEMFKFYVENMIQCNEKEREELCQILLDVQKV